MKSILKIVIGILVFIYLIVAMFSTVALLNRNDYKVTTFGNNSFFITDKDNQLGDYKGNTLLVIKKLPNSEINKGDFIFFYDTYSNQKVIGYSEITEKEDVTDQESTYTVATNDKVSSEYVMGTKNSTTSYATLGAILSVLLSRWGFLFIVVFPLALAFLYEIYAIVKELKSK